MSNKKKPNINDDSNTKLKDKSDNLVHAEKENTKARKTKKIEESKTSAIEKKEESNFSDESFKANKKKKSHIVVHLFLVLLLILAVGFFGFCLFDKNLSIPSLVANLILTLFTILFVVVGITYNRKKKGGLFLCSVLLFSYLAFLLGSSLYSLKTVDEFRGKALTYAIKWGEKNNITINQEYEYSDMIDEYKVISQSIKSGTYLKKVKAINLSISEGPNPSKEIIVPSMLTWDSERVLKFIKENYLSNVEIEFVESDKMKDTVIEQSKSGNLKRDEKIKLTFSYGEELGFEEVSLIDFTGKTKFEVEFYMKQHQLKYEFDYDFSSRLKKGKAIKQSVKAGKKVKVNDEKIKVTISKGPKIKIPDLKKMSASKISEWAIKNKLKLEFSDNYDDSVKENEVISINFKKGEIVEQGTVIKVVLSRGSLKMPKFKSLSEFREWADKYKIKYEEKHEFSDDVKSGEVISYSYKKGEVIKNNDSIIVKISDGKKCEVPNLKDLTKSEAISKLEKANLKYNFVYKASNNVKKDRVISQSMSAGSEVSEGTTITVTLSNGKKESSSSNSGSSWKPNGGGSNSGSNSGSGSSKPSTPTCDTSKGGYFFVGAGNTGDQVLASTRGQNPGFKVTATWVNSCPNGSSTSGSVCNSSSYDEKWVSYCTTVNLTIVR